MTDTTQDLSEQIEQLHAVVEAATDRELTLSAENGQLRRQLDAAEKTETRLRGELELMRTRLVKVGVTP